MDTDKSPPRWAQQLLRWLHHADTLEEPGPQVERDSETDRSGAVEGDLDDLYDYRYARAGKT